MIVMASLIDREGRGVTVLIISCLVVSAVYVIVCGGGCAWVIRIVEMYGGICWRSAVWREAHIYLQRQAS